MSMIGKLNYFLELQIKQARNGVFINQSKYCKELLKRFNMNNCKMIATPTSSSTHVDQDESSMPINTTKYRVMTSSFLDLTASYPDIMFSVCICAHYQ